MPFQMKPPHCSASDVTGSCRQSVNTAHQPAVAHLLIGAAQPQRRPGQITALVAVVADELGIQMPHLRLLIFRARRLLALGRRTPPLEYGGSAITASTVPNVAIISALSPQYSVARPIVSVFNSPIPFGLFGCDKTRSGQATDSTKKAEAGAGHLPCAPAIARPTGCDI